MTPQQFKNVMAMPAQKRYEHFIAKVSDWEEVWSLKNEEGFVTYGDDEGNVGIPFWPHSEYAKSSARDAWADCVPSKIDLQNYLTKWLPGMKGDGLLAVVFPTHLDSGIMLDPDLLCDNINQECDQYE